MPGLASGRHPAEGETQRVCRAVYAPAGLQGTATVKRLHASERTGRATAHRVAYFSFASNSSHRFQAFSSAFLLGSVASGNSPARMKPWPASS